MAGIDSQRCSSVDPDWIYLQASFYYLGNLKDPRGTWTYIHRVNGAWIDRIGPAFHGGGLCEIKRQPGFPSDFAAEPPTCAPAP